jgi:hypothetical protein
MGDPAHPHDTPTPTPTAGDFFVVLMDDEEWRLLNGVGTAHGVIPDHMTTRLTAFILANLSALTDRAMGKVDLRSPPAPATPVAVTNPGETYDIEAYRSELNRLEPELRRWKAQAEELQEFKVYVHVRLDQMGIPMHPEVEHGNAAGRIGDRLDIVQAERTQHQQKLDLQWQAAKAVEAERDQLAARLEKASALFAAAPGLEAATEKYRQVQ